MRTMDSRILIEICCGSVDDAVAAQTGGADRIELNSSLFLGGLTPSLGCVIETMERVDIPVMVMIRPRSGGFCYTESEMAAMLGDCRIMLNQGVDGVVFGILKEDGSVDMARCERMMDIIGESVAVFHRAFDVTAEPLKAIDQLIELGISRVLTSGAVATAIEGSSLIKQLIDHVAGRIEILPGAGIRDHNVRELVEITGASQVHFGIFEEHIDTSARKNPKITFAGNAPPPEDRYRVINARSVQKAKEQLSGL